MWEQSSREREREVDFYKWWRLHPNTKEGGRSEVGGEMGEKGFFVVVVVVQCGYLKYMLWWIRIDFKFDWLIDWWANKLFDCRLFFFCMNISSWWWMWISNEKKIDNDQPSTTSISQVTATENFFFCLNIFRQVWSGNKKFLWISNHD